MHCFKCVICLECQQGRLTINEVSKQTNKQSSRFCKRLPACWSISCIILKQNVFHEISLQHFLENFQHLNSLFFMGLLFQLRSGYHVILWQLSAKPRYQNMFYISDIDCIVASGYKYMPFFTMAQHLLGGHLSLSGWIRWLKRHVASDLIRVSVM